MADNFANFLFDFVWDHFKHFFSYKSIFGPYHLGLSDDAGLVFFSGSSVYKYHTVCV